MQRAAVCCAMLWALVAVALLWGGTNPFLKHFSAGIASRQRAGANFLSDFLFLFTRPGYVLALAINLLGSVLFYYALSDWPVSQVVPVANSLTFVVTAAVGVLCFDERVGGRDVAGMALVVAGVAVALQ